MSVFGRVEKQSVSVPGSSIVHISMSTMCQKIAPENLMSYLFDCWISKMKIKMVIPPREALVGFLGIQGYWPKT